MFTGARAPAGSTTMSTTQDAEGDEGAANPSGGDEGSKITSPTIETASSASVIADSPLVKEAEKPTTLNAASSGTDQASKDFVEILVSGDPLVSEVNSSVATVLHPNLLALEQHSGGPRYKIEQLHVDRRLLVNRKKQLKMYRVWMQGQFRKM
jgi:tRNAThr (cytosine32-N3)-methyltransferase